MWLVWFSGGIYYLSLSGENAVAFKKIWGLEVLCSPASTRRSWERYVCESGKVLRKRKGLGPLERLKSKSLSVRDCICQEGKCVRHILNKKACTALLSIGTILRKGANLRTACLVHYWLLVLKHFHEAFTIPIISQFPSILQEVRDQRNHCSN